MILGCKPVHWFAKYAICNSMKWKLFQFFRQECTFMLHKSLHPFPLHKIYYLLIQSRPKYGFSLIFKPTAFGYIWEQFIERYINIYIKRTDYLFLKSMHELTSCIYFCKYLMISWIWDKLQQRRNIYVLETLKANLIRNSKNFLFDSDRIYVKERNTNTCRKRFMGYQGNISKKETFGISLRFNLL